MFVENHSAKAGRRQMTFLENFYLSFMSLLESFMTNFYFLLFSLSFHFTLVSLCFKSMEWQHATPKFFFACVRGFFFSSFFSSGFFNGNVLLFPPKPKLGIFL